MDTKNLQFQEIKPGTNARREPVDTLRVWKNRLTIGKLAYEALGEPSSLKVEVDPRNNVVRLTPEGPFAIGKNHAISTVSLREIEEGLYVPMAEKGLYKWAVTE